jgi:shikimate kinase
MKKHIIVLIGLKGSGKTYIGTLIQEKLGIKFFRVENIWLSLPTERFSNEYIIEGFSLVEKELDRFLIDTDWIIIESTGATDYFNIFLDKIKSKYDVKLVKINTDPELCFKRVKSRDSSIHIPVSDDIVDKINRDALKVDLHYDLLINNDKSKDNEIIEKIQTIIK